MDSVHSMYSAIFLYLVCTNKTQIQIDAGPPRDSEASARVLFLFRSLFQPTQTYFSKSTAFLIFSLQNWFRLKTQKLKRFQFAFRWLTPTIRKKNDSFLHCPALGYVGLVDWLAGAVFIIVYDVWRRNYAIKPFQCALSLSACAKYFYYFVWQWSDLKYGFEWKPIEFDRSKLFSCLAQWINDVAGSRGKKTRRKWLMEWLELNSLNAVRID